MKKWVLKAIVQKTISWLPFKHRINFLFQTSKFRFPRGHFLTFACSPAEVKTKYRLAVASTLKSATVATISGSLRFQHGAWVC